MTKNGQTDSCPSMLISVIVQYNNSKTFSWRKVTVAGGAWYWSADTTFVDKRRLHVITHQKLIMCEVVQLMVS